MDNMTISESLCRFAPHASGMRHNWHVHTQAQFLVPTGEANNLSAAEVNRIEMRVTKVYCTHCLEVRDI